MPYTCSVVFLTRVRSAAAKAGDDAADAEWVALADHVELAFDHAEAIAVARRMLRKT